jgi:hypothetical protein
MRPLTVTAWQNKPKPKNKPKRYWDRRNETADNVNKQRRERLESGEGPVAIVPARMD